MRKRKTSGSTVVETCCRSYSVDSTAPDEDDPLEIEARIRTLEEQNEKLSAYAVRVSTEIEELRRLILRPH